MMGKFFLAVVAISLAVLIAARFGLSTCKLAKLHTCRKKLCRVTSFGPFFSRPRAGLLVASRGDKALGNDSSPDPGNQILRSTIFSRNSAIASEGLRPFGHAFAQFRMV
jgi:hypothetical protein